MSLPAPPQLTHIYAANTIDIYTELSSENLAQYWPDSEHSALQCYRQTGLGTAALQQQSEDCMQRSGAAAGGAATIQNIFMETEIFH